jgi:hypothetical protein
MVDDVKEFFCVKLELVPEYFLDTTWNFFGIFGLETGGQLKTCRWSLHRVLHDN